VTGKGASFPLRHISIRVPWHDHGWDGALVITEDDPAGGIDSPKIAELIVQLFGV